MQNRATDDSGKQIFRRLGHALSQYNCPHLQNLGKGCPFKLCRLVSFLSLPRIIQYLTIVRPVSGSSKRPKQSKGGFSYYVPIASQWLSGPSERECAVVVPPERFPEKKMTERDLVDGPDRRKKRINCDIYSLSRNRQRGPLKNDLLLRVACAKAPCAAAHNASLRTTFSRTSKFEGDRR